jgi:hypothetical protein
LQIAIFDPETSRMAFAAKVHVVGYDWNVAYSLAAENLGLAELPKIACRVTWAIRETQ